MSIILEYMNLPKVAKTNHRIPIKELFQEMTLSKSEKKIFSNEIERLYLTGVLDIETLRVNPFKDEDHLYESIYILNITLRDKTHFSFINEKIHTAFPNPLIIIYELDETFIISTAPKRINKITKEKSVIEAIFSSNQFTIDNSHNLFFKSLDFNSNKSIDLKGFYDQITDLIYSERLIELLGYYPKNIPVSMKLKETLKNIEVVNAIINGYKEDYKKASMMAEKMDIHMLIRKQERILEKIIVDLKEKLSDGENSKK